MARKSKRRSSSRAAETAAGSRSDRDRAIAGLHGAAGRASRSSRSASPRSPAAPACRSPICAPNSPPRSSILAAHIKEIDRAGAGRQRCRHGRGIAARAAVRRADAPARDRSRRTRRRCARCCARCRAIPGLALALNGLAVRSQQWMLTAAGIGASGPKGMLRAQGLALLFAACCAPGSTTTMTGLARTLAALDRELARGQRFAGMLDELCAAAGAGPAP